MAPTQQLQLLCRVKGIQVDASVGGRVARALAAVPPSGGLASRPRALKLVVNLCQRSHSGR